MTDSHGFCLFHLMQNFFIISVDKISVRASEFDLFNLNDVALMSQLDLHDAPLMEI